MKAALLSRLLDVLRPKQDTYKYVVHVQTFFVRFSMDKAVVYYANKLQSAAKKYPTTENAISQ